MLPTRAGGIINYPIRDLQTLYASYLPFVSGGAIFVPSNRTFPLGEDVFVVVTLPDSTERTPLTGKVVWVTHRIQGSRPAGFALQLLGDDGTRLKNQIEKMLVGLLTSDRPTYTM
jgi:type IV pilus assembly protein PilZ